MSIHSARVAYEDFCQQARSCREQDELLQAFQHFLAEVGFNCFAYVSTGLAGTHLHASYPMEWQRIYVERNYFTIDPILKLGRNATAAFGWACDDFIARRVQKRFFGQAAEFDLHSGVTIPLAGIYGEAACLTLASEIRNVDTGPVILAAYGGIITLASMHYHMHHERLMENSQKQGVISTILLTHKQRACLSWIARGKTAEEAAAVLGLATVTVSWHLARAKERLGAVTLPQAVALALHRGEIKL